MTSQADFASALTRSAGVSTRRNVRSYVRFNSMTSNSVSSAESSMIRARSKGFMVYSSNVCDQKPDLGKSELNSRTPKNSTPVLVNWYYSLASQRDKLEK